MPHHRITDLPAPDAAVRFQGSAARFVVTVDTEEEFDWAKPLTRDRHGTASVPRLARFQSFCESHGVVPIYLVDHPIATDPATTEALGAAVAAGRAEIGVQLHPWVNPPFEEEISERNSFAGNLPEALERAKFMNLRDAIERAFGCAPLIYRAGRYGTGPNTAAILREGGIRIDTSARARFDYSATGGPCYRDLPVTPWWVDAPGGLMELPLTTVYTGPLRRFGPALYPRLWRVPALRGALARARVLERIPLTPEGVSQAEAGRAIDVALADGLPVLVFSFHSPSLAPGHTPYVRSEADVDALYDWWRHAFARLAARGVRPSCVRDLLTTAELA